ncbi:hypothetical protein CANARDRAFT_10478 [[Candida] arabinofermentans NRRL YB-2248]|uniref:Uncharacterized protein n=1 Tax=[Candida] arabinofermentans NRRL YB-2248 TaxID=983967 RepID=A0A1E4SSN2_9ASCO|nr:hypothetical protein CANARDRAFT_10478 [[Candida] arabinofermentans NRRL YB-2248]
MTSTRTAKEESTMPSSTTSPKTKTKNTKRPSQLDFSLINNKDKSDSSYEDMAYKIVSAGLPPLSAKNKGIVMLGKAIEVQQKKLISERGIKSDSGSSISTTPSSTTSTTSKNSSNYKSDEIDHEEVAEEEEAAEQEQQEPTTGKRKPGSELPNTKPFKRSRAPPPLRIPPQHFNRLSHPMINSAPLRSLPVLGSAAPVAAFPSQSPIAFQGQPFAPYPYMYQTPIYPPSLIMPTPSVDKRVSFEDESTKRFKVTEANGELKITNEKPSMKKQHNNKHRMTLLQQQQQQQQQQHRIQMQHQLQLQAQAQAQAQLNMQMRLQNMQRMEQYHQMQYSATQSGSTGGEEEEEQEEEQEQEQGQEENEGEQDDEDDVESNAIEDDAESNTTTPKASKSSIITGSIKLNDQLYDYKFEAGQDEDENKQKFINFCNAIWDNFSS